MKQEILFLWRERISDKKASGLKLEEDNATTYIDKLAKQISEYVGENWIDTSAEDA